MNLLVPFSWHLIRIPTISFHSAPPLEVHALTILALSSDWNWAQLSLNPVVTMDVATIDTSSRPSDDQPG